MVYGLWSRVYGPGFRVQGSEFGYLHEWGIEHLVGHEGDEEPAASLAHGRLEVTQAVKHSR
jgi:hypothetical protein